MAQMLITIEGIDDGSPYVTIIGHCANCGELIHQTKLDSRVVTFDDAYRAGEQDGDAMETHVCQSREAAL